MRKKLDIIGAFIIFCFAPIPISNVYTDENLRMNTGSLLTVAAILVVMGTSLIITTISNLIDFKE